MWMGWMDMESLFRYVVGCEWVVGKWSVDLCGDVLTRAVRHRMRVVNCAWLWFDPEISHDKWKDCARNVAEFIFVVVRC